MTATAPAGEIERARTLFGQGLERFAAGDYQGAEQHFQQANQLAPDRQSILGNLSATLFRLGKVSEARTWALKALSLDANNFEACMSLGACLESEGSLQEALDCFEKASAIKPKAAEPWSNRGHVLNAMRRHHDALSCCERAVQLNPASAEAWANHGYSLKELRRFAEAATSLMRSLELRPSQADVLLSLGLTLRRLGRHEESLASFELAIGLEPDNAPLRVAHAGTLQILKRTEAALESVEKALAIDPALDTAWYCRGTLFQDLNRIDDALACHDKAIALNPDYVDAWSARTSLRMSRPGSEEQALSESITSLKVFLAGEFGSEARAGSESMWREGIAYFRLKHDFEQARYLIARGYTVEGMDNFVEIGRKLLDRPRVGTTGSELIRVIPAEVAAMLPYWKTPLLFNMPDHLPSCINPQLDWDAIEEAYLAGTPEIVHIDNFLAPEALSAFREYSLVSKVWLTEYPNKYLGAFANRGFISRLHLQLATELKQAMPRVLQDYRLTHLWGFKYDTTLGKGINVHADFAQVNLNFWITPDEYNLNPDAGGLKIYDVPSPPDWPFSDFNENKNKIYDFLDKHKANSVVVPHRCNRAVLFNSALFHETHDIHFRDAYEGRRVNITYLFGTQL
jgi:tetratricopeptide (TPR) repeat protein